MLKFSSMLTGIGIAVTVMVAMPFGVFAHMAAGSDAEVGPYVVDMGWSPDPLVADETAALSFNLVDKAKETPVEFESVWVRISSGDKIAFAGVLSAFGRNVTFTQTFPAAGEYEVTVRFLAADGAALAEKSFPLSVGAASAGKAEKGMVPRQSFPAAFVLALLLVALELAIHPRGAKKA